MEHIQAYLLHILPEVPIPMLAALYALLVILLASPLLAQAYRRNLVRRRLARRESGEEPVPEEEPTPGELERLFEQAGCDMSLQTFLALSIGAGLAVYALFHILGVGGVVPFLGGLAGLAAPYIVLREQAAGRMKRMEEDLVQALPQIAGAARMQPPVDTLLATAIDSLEPDRPLAAELRRLRADIAVRGADTVLREWESRLPPGGVREFALLFRLYARRGGEHADAFADSAERVIRFQELRAKAVAKAQGNLNIARMLPLIGIFVLFFSLRQPVAREFYASPIGQGLLILAALWMGLGYMVLRGMVEEIQ